MHNKEYLNKTKMILTIKEKCLLLMFTTLTQFIVNSEGLPNIIPNVKEILLTEGDRLEIKCTSAKHLKLYYPSNTIVEFNTNVTSPYVTSSINIIEESGDTHHATLVRSVTVRGDTGWYGCADFDVNVTPNIYDESDVKWLYVYVKSNSNWFVNSEDFFETFTSAPKLITIGCRPSSPDYHVNLYFDDMDITHDQRVVYDPKFGFTMSNITVKDGGYYNCSIEDHGITQSITYFLNLMLEMHVETKPIININTVISMNSSLSFLPGQEARINCTIDIDRSTPFTMTWNTTQHQYSCVAEHGRISTKYYENHKGKNKSTVNCQLTISHISPEDQGNYSCTIATFHSRKSVMTNIVVHES